MRLLIDMNLSPRLAEALQSAGHEATHWSDVGDPTADDREILDWAKGNDLTLITHDLDFGAILAATKANSPSVLQVRTQNVSPDHIAPLLISALDRYREHLESGALISLDETTMRARVLPI